MSSSEASTLNPNDLVYGDAFAAGLRSRLLSPLDGWRELQSSFAPTDAETGERLRRFPDDPDTARRAAVLVPVILEDAGPELVYTLRKDHLSDHAGQISFPGGGRDPSDNSLLETALREASEEIDLPRHAVEVAGTLENMYIPPSNFLVTPFVGLLNPGAKFTLAPEEVERVFTVPIRTLLHPKTYDRRLWSHEGRRLDVPVFAVEAEGKPYEIWGATAAITALLLARLGWRIPT
ncbi:NUDIX hydrolase [Rubrobacter indicoceani]|uniref:NUDIX hydrolase n=1 Tax=Rubrobacter indicoceani TaxID=2051957 RepID=UPI000E5A2E60|nr:CoA pyrophosphatase [Rubrobacter indicoceani]